jgi:peptide chain release factor subunit 1
MLLTETLDRLAAFEPVPFPVLSLYLDTRPGSTGRDNFEPWLRKALRNAQATYRSSSPEHESLKADLERVRSYVEREIRPSSNGVAVFACAGADGFFEAVQLEAPLEGNRLFLGDRPHLYPLARLEDQHPRYAVVVADTNFARILVVALGQVQRQENVEGVKTKHVKVGGWSQARYQRHVGEFQQQHVKEVAEVLDRIVREDGIERIVIGGDEVLLPLVRDELPPHLQERVVDVLHLDIGAPERDVIAASMDALRHHDAETDAQVVDKLFEAVRGSGLGALGGEDVKAALQLGQVDELVITARPDTLTNVNHLVPDRAGSAPAHTGEVQAGLEAVEQAAAAAGQKNESPEQAAPAEEQVADELVTLARQTGARVRFIEDPALLAEVGGVGALLRFRVDQPPA